MANKTNLSRAAGNRLSTTLSGNISAGALSLTVADATGFNTSGGYIILDEGNSKREIIYYNSIAGSTLTIADNGRGLSGTTAVSHDSGATVTDILTAQHIEDLITQFLLEHSDDGSHGDVDATTLDTTGNVTVGGTLVATGQVTASAGVVLPNTTYSTDRKMGYDGIEEEFTVGDGTNIQKIRVGAWKTFTPSLTNITLGSGSTSEGRYTIIGKTCLYRIYIQLGTGGSISGNASVALPVTAATYTNNAQVGQVWLRDSSPSANYIGNHNVTGGLSVLGVGGTYLDTANVSATVPITWAVGDYIHITGAYEIA